MQKGGFQMEIVNSLIEFFGIDMLTDSATFVDLLNVLMRIGVSVYVTVFIIRSVFLTATLPERRMF